MVEEKPLTSPLFYKATPDAVIIAFSNGAELPPQEARAPEEDEEQNPIRSSEQNQTIIFIESFVDPVFSDEEEMGEEERLFQREILRQFILGGQRRMKHFSAREEQFEIDW